MMIGKKMVIEGLAGSYTADRYQKWLKETSLDKFFTS